MMKTNKDYRKMHASDCTIWNLDDRFLVADARSYHRIEHYDPTSDRYNFKDADYWKTQRKAHDNRFRGLSGTRQGITQWDWSDEDLGIEAFNAEEYVTRL